MLPAPASSLSICFWKLGEFFDDLGCAHDGSLTGQAGLINLGELFNALVLRAIARLLHGLDNFRNGARG
jgi:hypothetical protein